MKKVGILTFHRAHNYGAFLQCYALSNKIRRENPGTTVEVIDAEAKAMADYYSTSLIDMVFSRANIKARNLRGMLSSAKQFAIRELHDPKYLQRKRQQAELFIGEQKHLQRSEERITTADTDAFLDMIERQGYDAVVVGSDAVFNDYQTHQPNPFYLSEKVTAKKLSYAASSYGFPYRDQPEDLKAKATASLKDFAYLGVRDGETERYMEYLGVGNVHHTPDPSMFFPMDEIRTEEMLAELTGLLKSHGIDTSKEVYAVMGGNWLGQIAREIIGPDKQLVAIYAQNKYADAYIHDLRPLQWACVFKLFRMTFTSFFHGTIFSLLNDTPTFTVEDKSPYAKQYVTKTRDLLNRIGLSDYYYTLNDGDISKELRAHYEDLLANDQTERIRHALSEERKHYASFDAALKEALK